MNAIRAVMVTMPPLVGDLIKQLTTGHVDLEVVGEFGSRHDVAHGLLALRPDLVVIGLRRNEGEAVVLRLLELTPRAKVVAVTHDGRNILGFELQRRRFSDLSPHDLLDFIRDRGVDRDGDAG